MSRQQLRLTDGRRIEYLELGDPAGVPAVYLHGTPSSASEARWLHGSAQRLGVRLVSFDRPGYLRSQARRRPSFMDIAEDVVAAARALRLERFAVVGFSGGAAYALATAYLAPAEVIVIHMGGGIWSLTGAFSGDLPRARRVPFRVIAGVPVLSRPLLGGVFRLLRRGLAKRMDLPAEAARWFFDGPAKGAQIEAVAEYIRTSTPVDLRSELTDFAAGTRATRAIVADVAGYFRTSPVDVHELATPVEIWHGREDPAAPVAAAERLASLLPNVRAHIFDGEGHFVFHGHADAVVESIRTHAAS